MKKWTNILIYTSFVFLFIYLIRQDYVQPEIKSIPYLISSIVLLFSGFVVSTFSWRRALIKNGKTISHSTAIRSHGMSVFTKYIPGKIWVILGRASAIASDKDEVKKFSFISFQEQMIYLWTGFVISLIPSLLFVKEIWINLSLVVTIVGLSFFLFVPWFNQMMSRILKKLSKKDLNIPSMSFKSNLAIIVSTFWIWLFWTSSFYCFGKSLSDDFYWHMSFAFPLSVCLGLLAIFLPGGLGLREGIITSFLHYCGLDLVLASTIAFSNRLCFISGEVFIFLLALFQPKQD